MQLSELFGPEDFALNIRCADKWDAIRLLVEHIVQRHDLDTEFREKVHTLVLTRERSMSTGMERGIAIPHAAVDQIDDVVACMGIVTRPDGLAFESIDARPARLIVLLVIPRSQKLLHIRTLADVARVLALETVRDALLAARTSEAAWGALSTAEAERR